jgi:hypothetical protein
MTRKEYELRDAFAAIITRESSSKLAENYARLILRHGATYSRLQEANCNGVGTYYGEDIMQFNARQDRFEKAVEKKEQAIEKRITAICRELGDGFEPIFSGDPRGNTIKIKVPSGRTNDWAREGVSVPTS